MKKYETEMLKNNRYREAVDVELVKNGMINGGIFWTTGFSKFTLSVEGVIESNIKEIREWYMKGGIDNVLLNTAEQNGIYKYIKTGISGSTWKYLQLAFFCDFKELDKIYHIAIAYLVGCYHHSWYEVTKTTLDFFNDDIFKQLLKSYNYKQTEINDSFWKLNKNTKLTKVKENLSLSSEIKYIIRNSFFNQIQGISHSKTYLRFYMNYLLPLIGIGDSVIFKYDKGVPLRFQKTANVKRSQIFFNCLDISENTNLSEVEREKQDELNRLKRQRSIEMSIFGGSKVKRKTRKNKLKTVFPYLSRKNRSLMYG